MVEGAGPKAGDARGASPERVEVGNREERMERAARSGRSTPAARGRRELWF